MIRGVALLVAQLPPSSSSAHDVHDYAMLPISSPVVSRARRKYPAVLAQLSGRSLMLRSLFNDFLRDVAAVPPFVSFFSFPSSSSSVDVRTTPTALPPPSLSLSLSPTCPVGHCCRSLRFSYSSFLCLCLSSTICRGLSTLLRVVSFHRALLPHVRGMRLHSASLLARSPPPLSRLMSLCGIRADFVGFLSVVDADCYSASPWSSL